MHRVRPRSVVCHQCMTPLVVGGQLAAAVAEDGGLALRTHDDAVASVPAGGGRGSIANIYLAITVDLRPHSGTEARGAIKGGLGG